MKQFDYVITDELGIHARPAALLVQEAKKYDCKVGINCNGKSADASKLFTIMSLAFKCGQKVTVTLGGPAEADAYTAFKKFFEEKL